MDDFLLSDQQYIRKGEGQARPVYQWQLRCHVIILEKF